jgi:hypothetical protein
MGTTDWTVSNEGCKEMYVIRGLYVARRTISGESDLVKRTIVVLSRRLEVRA